MWLAPHYLFEVDDPSDQLRRTYFEYSVVDALHQQQVDDN